MAHATGRRSTRKRSPVQYRQAPRPGPGQQRYTERLTLKLTSDGRKELSRQAQKADTRFKNNDSEYLRELLTRDRRRMKLRKFAF